MLRKTGAAYDFGDDLYPCLFDGVDGCGLDVSREAPGRKLWGQSGLTKLSLQS
jgi:hypothetical protein